MAAKFDTLVIDCDDTLKVARFWATLLDYKLEDWSTADEAAVTGSEGPQILFIKVPEGKTLKNRLHLDLVPETTVADEVARAISLGAQQYAVFPTWTVMQDPEGNEFCFVKNQQEREADKAKAGSN